MYIQGLFTFILAGLSIAVAKDSWKDIKDPWKPKYPVKDSWKPKDPWKQKSSWKPYKPNHPREAVIVEVNRGYHRTGGKQVKGYFPSDNECLTECLKDPWCYAVDYSVDSKTCWSHEEKTACYNKLEYMAGTIHYRVKMCAAKTTKPPMTTPHLLPKKAKFPHDFHALVKPHALPKPHAVPKLHVPTPHKPKMRLPMPLEVFDGVCQLYGRQVSKALTIEHCIAECASTFGCAGIDFIFGNPPSCKIHSTSSECGASEVNTNCIHLRYKPCDHPGSDSTFVPMATRSLCVVLNANLPFGQEVKGIKRYGDCVQYCRDTTGCLSVDFDFVNEKCFRHDVTTACPGDTLTSGSTPGVVHFTLDTASPCGVASNAAPQCVMILDELSLNSMFQLGAQAQQNASVKDHKQKTVARMLAILNSPALKKLVHSNTILQQLYATLAAPGVASRLQANDLLALDNLLHMLLQLAGSTGH